MQKAAREALLKKLGITKNFDRRYRKENRRWFVDKLIRDYDTGGASDAQVQAKVTDIVTKSASMVKNNKQVRNFPIKIKSKLSKFHPPRRVEILYGAIGTHPGLVESAHQDLLLFVARRRLRSVVRTDYYVNPSKLFRYLKACGSANRWRVNVDAKPHWETFTRTPDPARPGYYKGLHIPLKRPSTGEPDRVQAVASLFTSKKEAWTDPCKANLLDCALTAGAVFLDSLLEAHDPKRLLAKIDSRGPQSLAVHYVSNEPPGSMLLDKSNESLFQVGDASVGDLQVGDHVYLFNHPLYLVFKPSGDWRGEHSLIYNLRNRNYRSAGGILLGGHGKEGTVYSIYSGFGAELQTHLHRAYKIGKVFLDYKRSNETSLPAGKVTKYAGPVGGVATEFYELDVSIKHNAYASKTGLTKPTGTRTESKFVIAYQPSHYRFMIDEKKTVAEVQAADKLTNPIQFKRSGTAAGSTQFKPAEWGIVYFDLSTKSEKRFVPFVEKRGRVTFNSLTMSDLFASPFYKRDPNKEKIGVLTPKVDTSANYDAFLRVNGALPDVI